ncbi:Stage V sporulation protein K [Pirellulimonas nuda]|uniref:Stage V sporulation protein K n=1 Tax=Pirellulimonas nuda TaxID=2528009 RepID=A0A518DA84_9BACT|nr:AAA family ATPase [Pirellulimonas nuda]QDU88358.1 Stage V sporulation protein K [Pirellulimonas nuda]
MSDFGFPSQPSLYSRTLRECRELYVSSGERIARDYPELIARDGQEYVTLMDDLHKGVLIKTYVAVCEADREWSKEERFLAEVLCHHLWGQWLEGATLREAIKRASDSAAKMTWYSLLRPFDRMPPLRDRVAELETVITRVANLVARADGSLKPEEQQAIQAIQDQLHHHLLRIPLDDDPEPDASPDARAPSTPAAVESERVDEPRTSERLRRIRDAADQPKPVGRRDAKPPQEKISKADKPAPPQAPQPTVEESLAELDRLIGLDSIKHEVRSLANFLKLQQRRTAAGLPETDISLHMVFTGNPGTGKTTVARIIGRIFSALGVLEKGHLIETDRSGLVAEYAGQTGPKTNKKIDEALGGVLFIDEAYSLVASRQDDAFGHEAVQALLKRSEDDRERLVVILAGYPDEMAALLASNPGLSSRFNRQLAFDDYTPLELARIFGLMCVKNHYQLTPAARLKVMIGLKWEYDHRDRHFGNGRAVRNLFEQAIRRMANRLATQVEIDQQELVTLQGPDIEFEDVPSAAFESIDEGLLRFRLECAGCGHTKVVSTKLLGEKVKCPKCDQSFTVEWGELIASGESDSPDP